MKIRYLCTASKKNCFPFLLAPHAPRAIPIRNQAQKCQTLHYTIIHTSATGVVLTIEQETHEAVSVNSSADSSKKYMHTKEITRNWLKLWGSAISKKRKASVIILLAWHWSSTSRWCNRALPLMCRNTILHGAWQWSESCQPLLHCEICLHDWSPCIIMVQVVNGIWIAWNVTNLYLCRTFFVIVR